MRYSAERRRGWQFGGEEFRWEMLGRVEDSLKKAHRSSFSGGEVRAHDEACAEAWIAQGMKTLGIAEADLSGLRMNSPEKYGLAWLVRRKTSVKVTWIKERLHMGRATDFSAWIKKLETSRAGEWGNAARLRVKDINS